MAFRNSTVYTALLQKLFIPLIDIVLEYMDCSEGISNPKSINVKVHDIIAIPTSSPNQTKFAYIDTECKVISVTDAIPNSPIVKLNLQTPVFDYGPHTKNEYKLFGFFNTIICVHRYAIAHSSEFHSSVEIYYLDNFYPNVNVQEADEVIDIEDSITHVVKLFPSIYIVLVDLIYMCGISKNTIKKHL
jgi:hypothetical protein